MVRAAHWRGTARLSRPSRTLPALIALIALAATTVPPAAAVAGTYSAYVRYLRGLAVTVEINVGAMEPHEEESKELRRRERELSKLLGPRDDAYVQSLMSHFMSGKHGYRRCRKLVRYDSAHPWPRVEDMWGSEMTTNGLTVPLPKRPAPAGNELGLTEYRRPERVTLYLFLKEHVDHHVRDYMVLQFAASHLHRKRGLFANVPAPDRDHLDSADHHFRTFELMAWVRTHRKQIEEIAAGPVPVAFEDTQRYLWAHAFLHALSGRPYSAQVLELLRTRGDDHAAELFAGLTCDRDWPTVAKALERWPWATSCAP